MKYKIGYHDGSGESTIVRQNSADPKDTTPVLAPWNEKGCGCCADVATEDDLALLRKVVDLLNGRRPRRTKKTKTRALPGREKGNG